MAPRPDLPLPTPEKPEILAPAGDVSCFLAALAAGADNIYLGLKQFSARMQSENFGLTELSRLCDLAHENGARVTVAMNTLVRDREVDAVARLMRRLEIQAGCDGIIVQDPALLDLARQSGFTGGLTLSTLANVTHPLALREAKALGADRVVLPRELSIDEIRAAAEACPEGLSLECFIHGALCYCVSGRCYWSSYLGGKSGLRGRCVQPCRRVYAQGPAALQLAARRAPQDRPTRARQDVSPRRSDRQPRTGKNQEGRYFSCQDLSLDVLTKTLLGIPHLVSWKIEGRRKGPHYVYHAVTAYRILRDNPGDTQARKMADDILAMALGRPSTRARFLPQRAGVPVDPSGQTSSGLFVGKTGIGPDGQPFVKPHIPLLPKDYLRIGVEDEKWHATLPVTRSTPKGGSLVLRLPRHRTPPAGIPVYLLDRREPELEKLLGHWSRRLEEMEERQTAAVTVSLPGLRPAPRRTLPSMSVFADMPQGRETRGSRNFLSCLWLTPRTAGLSRTAVRRFGWWLPPVLWPDEEAEWQKMVEHLWREGARTFVCNSPWQMALFSGEMRADREACLTAGPFCNLANARTAEVFRKMGFHAAMVSPELNAEAMLALPARSPLPLGVVLAGAWPVGISRYGTLGIRLNEPFTSPKGEVFWARQYGENVWIYPGWQLNISARRQELEKAGYAFTVTLRENVPASVPQTDRPGLFNWENDLL